MKTLLIILVTICTGTFIGVYTRSSRSVDHAVIIISDRTDSMLQPSAPDIIQYCDIETHKWQSLTIELTSITDLSINPVMELKLPGKNMLFANPYERDKEVQKFKQVLGQTIDSFYKGMSTRKYSNIYLTIAQAVNMISQSGARNKDIYVYSDLAQNMPGWSIYDSKEYEQCSKDQQKVEGYFSSLCRIYPCNGVKIHFIYQPKVIQDNERFSLMARLFQQLFERAGAQVYVSPNLGSNGQN